MLSKSVLKKWMQRNRLPVLLSFHKKYSNEPVVWLTAYDLGDHDLQYRIGKIAFYVGNFKQFLWLWPYLYLK